MAANPKLSKPQAEFVGLDAAFPLFVGGYGSGKTYAGCSKLLKSAWEYPRVPLGYFAPTYGDIKHTFFPSIEECAEIWGLNVLIRKGDFEVDLFSGRTYRTTIICRSMKNPVDIRGYNIGRGMIDEIDTLKPIQAAEAWRKAMARKRYRFDGVAWLGVTTTPEGFRFAWEYWEKKVREDIAKGSPLNLATKYRLVRASTYENEVNLQAGYIDDILSTYTETLAKVYLLGEFSNLTSGTVYVQYDREENGSTETIQPHDILYIGMDFNIDHMAAVVFVMRDGLPHAVDEIVDAFDTPKIIQIIKERYWPYKDGDYDKTAHQIRIYPDSTGKNRTRMGAGINDIELLRQAGFSVSAHPANPPIKDRVNGMNAMFCNAEGNRRSFVNVSMAPNHAENLEQQAYAENGEPDKSAGRDHGLDAAGYFHHYVYPLRRPVTKLKLRVAM